MKELKNFDQLQADLTVFVAPIKDLVVSSKESMEQAQATLRELKRWSTKIEDVRKQLVGPLNDQVKRINEYAKVIGGPLLDAEATLKQRLLDFDKVLELERQEQRKREEEERLKREAEAQAKIKEQLAQAETLAMFETPEQAAERAAAAQAEATRIQFEAKKEHWDRSKEIKSNKVKGIRRTWTFEIEDASLVPRHLLSVDEKKVKAAIAAGETTIPGLRIFQQESMTVR